MPKKFAIITTLSFLLILGCAFFFIHITSTEAAEATSNCIQTDIGTIPDNYKPPENLSPKCLVISGDAKQLAKQILAMPDKIFLSSEAKQDLQSVVDGTPITACPSGKYAMYPKLGSGSSTLHPILLQVLVQLAQKHTFSIWNFVTDHGCDGQLHPVGRATDIGQADGMNPWQNKSFRQDAADLLPSGSRINQNPPCAGSEYVDPKGKKIYQDNTDGCNHQHFDIGCMFDNMCGN